MDNDSFLRIAEAEHIGYLRLASQKRAERIRNGSYETACFVDRSMTC